MRTPLTEVLRRVTVLAILAGVGMFAATADASPVYRLFWNPRTEVGSPGPRYGHALAYDSDRRVTVFFGGEYSEAGGDPAFFNDTWEYDGVSWKRITIDGPVPEARSRHALCYDNVLRQVILFGGKNGSSFLSDVWNYESTGPQRGRWTHRTMGLGPGGRAAHTMIFDYFGGQAIVAGGTPDPAASPYRQTSDTWAWDNSSGVWSLRSEIVGYYAGQVLGAGLADHMMLYDYRRREAVVVGGIGPYGTKLVANAQMFFVLRESGSWSRDCGSTVAEGALVYDGFHDIYFQFGGTDYLLGEYEPQYASPGRERVFHRGVEGFPCAYRPSDTTVVFSDHGQPDVRPGPRAQCAMVYDEHRRVTVLFGGLGGTRYGDTWELVTKDLRETWVDFNHPGGREVGTFELPYNTLAEGVAAVAEGGTLKIKTGSTPETPQLTKPMTLEAIGGPVTLGR